MNAPLDTQYLTHMIKAYVPEADQMSREDAEQLAIVRDVVAADQLIESVETQLNLEAAATAINASLDDVFTGIPFSYRLN